MVQLTGEAMFRERIVYATLSGRAVTIRGIRERSESPGVSEEEASLLRLMDKLCNGMRVELNETGTTVRYFPGSIQGGAVAHECGATGGRGLSWWIEALVMLGPFARKPIVAQLGGATDGSVWDPSIDTVRAVTVPTMARLFGMEGLSVEVKRRGCPPTGGGLVVVRVPITRECLPPVEATSVGRFVRVRGVAWSMRVGPGSGNRMGEGAKAVLHGLLHDVHVHTDHCRGAEAGGKSPGFGLSLVAESVGGKVLLGADVSPRAVAEVNGATGEVELPEDLGRRCAASLLEEVYQGGCCDSAHQGLVLALMAIGPEDASVIRLGKITPRAVEVLRLLRTFFSVTFFIRPGDEARGAKGRRGGAGAGAAGGGGPPAKVAKLSDGMTREEMMNNADVNPSEYGKKNKRGGLGKRVRFDDAQDKDGGGNGSDDATGAGVGGDEDDDEFEGEDEEVRAFLQRRKAQTVLLSCMGIGMRNLARVAT